MSDTTKSAFIVRDLPKSEDKEEDLEQLRKMKNDIARKLRHAKNQKFFSEHPEIAKLTSLKEVEKVEKVEKAEKLEIRLEIANVKEPEPERPKKVQSHEPSKPIDIPKPKPVPVHVPSPLINNLVANSSGKWF